MEWLLTRLGAPIAGSQILAGAPFSQSHRFHRNVNKPSQIVSIIVLGTVLDI